MKTKAKNSYHKYINISNCIFLILLVCSSTVSSSTFFVGDTYIYVKWVYVLLFATLLTVSESLWLTKTKSTVTFTRNEIIAIFLFLCICALKFLQNDVEWSIKGLSCFILLIYFKSRNEMTPTNTSFEHTLIIIALTSSFYALFQYLHKDTTTNMSGFYDNPVGFAFTISIAAILVTKQLTICTSTCYKVLYSIILVFMIIVICMSGSRTGMISLFLCLCIALKNIRKYLIVAFLCVSTLSILFLKTDSSQGRLFIYKTTISMFDNPHDILFGKGTKGFEKHYMTYQAKALKSADENTKNRADDIKHPLNEFLLFGIDNGLLPTALLLLSFIIYAWGKPKDIVTIQTFIVICLFSSFSYPFKYPISWIVLAWCLSNTKAFGQQYTNTKYATLAFAYITSAICISSFLIETIPSLLTWRQAYDQSRLGFTDKALFLYRKAAKKCSYSEFYYNYSSFLLNCGRYQQAMQIIDKCQIASYDVQLLKAEICMSEKRYKQANMYCNIAHEMCPNRFRPLMCMFYIYAKIGCITKQKAIAQIIVKKRVKINSPEINRYKAEAKKFLRQHPQKSNQNL